MSFSEISAVLLTSLVQSVPFFVPLFWLLYNTGPGNKSSNMTVLRKLVGIILLLSIGALMPSFLFMGWSRDARAVDDIFYTSSALANLHYNRSNYMYRNLSKGPARLEDIVLFGEEERGIDLESQGWEDVKSKREFIKQVGY